MSVLIVTYDLIKETHKENYENILGVIKKEGNWARLSESCYAIRTDKTPQTVYEQVKPFLHERDHLLIFTATRPYFGWHSKEVIDWLDSSL
ncbi:hypothetical protein OKW38_005163 [Paraburkholderia sp. MM5496-R1]|uniref:hypothetical protein n=1 Tax=Paraburkholderia sp. MM5496-R1 TaxID=2991065 RepID=UPI003D204CF9